MNKSFSTLSELILFQANNFSHKNAFNFKNKNQLQSFSNQDFLQNTFYFACGLKEIGFQKSQTLAIFSYQNPIWMIADLGTILAGGITVPIFHNISEEHLQFEINDAKISYLFTDKKELISHKLPIKKTITFGFEPFDKQGFISYDSLVLLGKKSIEEGKYNLNQLINLTKENDLATIIYTSGTSGQPKGVELTHLNLVSQIKGAGKIFTLDSNYDKALSFLPLAHVFERMVTLFYVSCGIPIYFVNDINSLSHFLKEVKPTLMTTVPRMLEKVFIKIREGANQKKGIKKLIAKKAIEYALNKNPNKSKSFLDKFFNLLVYRKLQQALGGNIRFIICGGAALSQSMESFYQNIGINLFCGYGLTETSPVLAVNHQKAYRFGTVGQAFPGVKLKIANDSELLASGPNIMRSYHNDHEKTNQTIVDGWLLTGDLAEIDKEGFVKIIGRKKELLKNANGKYISPLPIEQKLIESLGFLVGAIVIAEGYNFTSALLFPDFEILPKLKNKFSAEGISDEEFLTSKPLLKFAEDEINKINKKLDGWQQIKKFQIIVQPISIESGEITPSMKLKRDLLIKKFKSVIDEFYNN